MLDALFAPLTEWTINGLALWAVLLCCCGAFLAALIDAIGGGGGIILLPTYLMAFSGLPTYYALGTSKTTSSIFTLFSTARFIKRGYVDWGLCLPGIVLSLLGSTAGVWLQHHTPDAALKYMLIAVLPVVAFITLRDKEWPDEPGEISRKKQLLIVCAAALIIGMYDGYYGPGTGTFLMMAFIRLAKMDVRHASGCTKVLNLASNVGSFISVLRAGYVFLGVGLICAAAGIVGANIGSSLALKNGSKLVKPTVVFVLILLCLKVVSEILFPSFWV